MKLAFHVFDFINTAIKMIIAAMPLEPLGLYRGEGKTSTSPFSVLKGVVVFYWEGQDIVKYS